MEENYFIDMDLKISQIKEILKGVDKDWWAYYLTYCASIFNVDESKVIVEKSLETDAKHARYMYWLVLYKICGKSYNTIAKITNSEARNVQKGTNKMIDLIRDTESPIFREKWRMIHAAIDKNYAYDLGENKNCKKWQ